MAADPGCNPGLQNSVPYCSDRGVIKRSDVAPHRRRLAHVSGNAALQQVIPDVGEIVFGGFERLARTWPHADSTKSAVNGGCVTRSPGDISAGALEGRHHQTRSRQVKALCSQIALEDFAHRLRGLR